MIDLRKSIQRHFNPGVRFRGEDILQRGDVKRLKGDAFRARATVTGNGSYFVRADRKGPALEASCECAYFLDHLSCKHLWAFLLAAEQHGFLGGEDGSAPKSLRLLVHDEPIEAQPASVPWREVLKEIQTAPPSTSVREAETWPQGREVFFVLGTRIANGINVDLLFRDPLQKGGMGKVKPLTINYETVPRVPDASLRELLLLLGGAPGSSAFGLGGFRSNYAISGEFTDFYLRRICESGHCYWRQDHHSQPESWTELQWDDGPAWQLTLAMKREAAGWRLTSHLSRAHERMELTEVVLLTESGIVVARGRLARFDHRRAFRWISALWSKGGELLVPNEHAREFAFEAARSGVPPPVDWPEELAFEVLGAAPVPWLSLVQQKGFRGSAMTARLRFHYGEHIAAWGNTQDSFADFEKRKIVRRDKDAEAGAVRRVEALGFRPSAWYHAQDGQWEVNASGAALMKLIGTLVKEGWRVDASGVRYKAASNFSAALSSGIDWFELDGGADFEGQRIELPELLKALETGSHSIQLADGEVGLIPEEVLQRFRVLVGLGRNEDGKIRFAKSQAGLLDVLLAERPEVSYDATFAEAREKLRGFAGVKASEQPEGFRGTLRGYQLDGLGWMKFLDEFGFGGCLADDMGVGKTPQVLAMLETRRSAGAGASLVVVPRSLVYNWKQEADRFTPQLRVLDHTAADRDRQQDFSGYDLVISTYGTLRKDAAEFRDLEFDYVILDEAQAIKNSSSESAKAARLLKGRRRLVMTGTPIENHLGELWSLFEFLNPGMLGSAKAFKGSGALKNPDEETRRVLGKALRPFLLRRTKEQVASELPPKQEQTIYCDLDSKQRELYNELRDFYRAKLLGKIGREGLNKSKMQVLEALLRLRQAALHPALLGQKHIGAASAKLDVMMDQLTEVLDEGHKALVFSQFTSFLSIVRAELDERGVVYEYLDGQTKDRQARVERFQSDSKCPVFLVSLKAGGVGLNLTAADYVFLLDPWWNPAVEAQAIDRTHRIGQTRSVFAYRLIARDTVEERVLELQGKKRDLAAAIVGEDNSLIRDLSAEDLETLLS
jgi:superfamily II DNA or RNA helicase